MEFVEILKAAQAAGAPVAILAVYFLWKIERRLTIVINTNDVLTETLIRLVPGFKAANAEAIKELALKGQKDP